ncbi:PKHD-type hydroxylase [Idiomarina loihiensis]|uniref:Fe2+-dependent dioxygenase n=1 Tax=Idiomarina TaxID=135575 RepID=UPI000D712938|nr:MULTISPECIES: Fe2+-dependent dioxygenase [Idiomarina]PWW35302.1 PKHD-type hydroxylase [Idiomarina loihiensis]TDP45242.1 PKHD-type hydroxylase [Idiomarina loihiensis]TDS21037.1 PKHD-type hydroxylase [Idiomarina sp. H2]
MILQISNAVDTDTVKSIVAGLDAGQFSDGKKTAGWAAKDVKNNQQLSGKKSEAATEVLLDRLQQNALVQSVMRPKQVARVTINRYQQGEYYGTHMDDSLMNGVRTDISFTLGLSPLSDFDGGELVIEDASGERSWRLGQGDILMYPSHYLHRVNPVTKGSRLAMIGWVQSLVKQPNYRELLFDIEQSLKAEFDANGKSENFDRLTKVFHNLLREWADV